MNQHSMSYVRGLFAGGILLHCLPFLPEPSGQKKQLSCFSEAVTSFLSVSSICQAATRPARPAPVPPRPTAPPAPRWPPC